MYNVHASIASRSLKNMYSLDQIHLRKTILEGELRMEKEVKHVD